MREKTSTIKFTKPYYQWLFGGMGFHNSEITMTPMIPEKLMNERLLKIFHEIRPSFSRVYGGFHDWTREAMDHFADYYEKTFAKADTAVYMVPGRMPLHETEEEMEAFVEETTDKIEYLLKEKKLNLIQFFCTTNELSVGNTYALLAKDLNKFKKYHQLFWNEFKKRKIDLGLIASDGSGIAPFTEQLAWAIENMDEYTRCYCGHNYEIYPVTENGNGPDFKFDDPGFYKYLYDSYSYAVSLAKSKEKRFMLGEFGIKEQAISTPILKSTAMVPDIQSGFGEKKPKEEAEFALMACVEELAAMNAGVLCTTFWTFCDYPDPFLPWYGSTPEARARYEAGRFSGHGTEIRYNKNGLFRWSSDGDYSAKAHLYSVGLMAKFFKSNSRVLDWSSDNEKLICGGVNNPDGSVSLCIINLSDEEEETNVITEYKLDKAFRKYEYLCSNVPENEFGDLQPFTYLGADNDNDFFIKLRPHSMIILTTDYMERKSNAVEHVSVSDRGIHWDMSDDEYHAYYRVFEDGKQIASTAAEYVAYAVKEGAQYTVKSVDRFGNLS